jgi:secreted PhoX family phosphatase
MLRRLGRRAEDISASMSRRGFLGGLSRSALAAAAGLGTLLALRSSARADTGQKCCIDLKTGKRCRLRHGVHACPEGFEPTYCDIPLRGNKNWCDELE